MKIKILKIDLLKICFLAWFFSQFLSHAQEKNNNQNNKNFEEHKVIPHTSFTKHELINYKKNLSHSYLAFVSDGNLPSERMGHAFFIFSYKELVNPEDLQKKNLSISIGYNLYFDIDEEIKVDLNKIKFLVNSLGNINPLTDLPLIKKLNEKNLISWMPLFGKKKSLPGNHNQFILESETSKKYIGSYQKSERHIVVHRLKFTEEQSKKLFQLLYEDILVLNFSKSAEYSALKNNCITNMFSKINAVANNDQKFSVAYSSNNPSNFLQNIDGLTNFAPFTAYNQILKRKEIIDPTPSLVFLSGVVKKINYRVSLKKSLLQFFEECSFGAKEKTISKVLIDYIHSEETVLSKKYIEYLREIYNTCTKTNSTKEMVNAYNHVISSYSMNFKTRGQETKGIDYLFKVNPEFVIKF